MRMVWVSGIVAAALALPATASAALVTYDVNMNFDPAHILAGSGVGTITGTFTIDTSIAVPGTPGASVTQPTDVVAVDLTEATNNGQPNIGGAFGSPSYSSITFNEVAPSVHIFFGSPISLPTSLAHYGQNNYEFNGNPFLLLNFQTSASYFDGTLIGPAIQFDFAYPQGSAVQAGNFDSITSENKYLFGTVTPEGSAVPEPATWLSMIAGLGLLGAVMRRQSLQHRFAFR